jgi:hypothetical protein
MLLHCDIALQQKLVYKGCKVVREDNAASDPIWGLNPWTFELSTWLHAQFALTRPEKAIRRDEAPRE